MKVRHAGRRQRAERPRFLSPQQGRRLFDREARAALGMSGATFLRRWKAGQIPNPDRPEVLRVVALLPLAG